MDIFEDLKEIFGFTYISEMKASRSIKSYVGSMNLKVYPLSQLSDLYNYLYDEPIMFSDYAEAQDVFRAKR